MLTDSEITNLRTACFTSGMRENRPDWAKNLDDLAAKLNSLRHKAETFVVFGGSFEAVANSGVDHKEFNTQQELSAYMLGLADSNGWDDVNTFDSMEEANEYVAQAKQHIAGTSQ